MDSPYPNFTERIVASALLLLSSSPSDEEITGKCNVDRCESLLWNNSVSVSRSRSSASSTVSTDDVSSVEARARRLRMVASSVARSKHALKLKVVKKSRSKTLWISDSRRMSNAKHKFVSMSYSSSLTAEGSSLTAEGSSLTAEGSSCMSGGSSSLVSSSKSCRSKMKREQDAKKKPSYMICSAHLLRRSEAIMKVLAHNGCASEVRIRQILGDSPDTSKALRILLKKKKVRRSGAGGRTDPFIYQISAK